VSHPLDRQPNRRPARWWHNLIALLVLAAVIVTIALAIGALT
jgi:hypothetical protein